MYWRVVTAIAVFECPVTEIKHTVESGGEERCRIVPTQNGVRARDRGGRVWFFASSCAQHRNDHRHKDAGRYSLAAHIAYDDCQPITVQLEKIVEVAAYLSSWPNFRADL